MPYAKLDKSLCRDRRISNAQFRVLANLCTYANDDGFCWPSMRQQARDLHRTPATIRHHLNGLVELGVITRDPRLRKDGSRGANRYWVPRPRYAAAEPAPADQPAASGSGEQQSPTTLYQPSLLLPQNGAKRRTERVNGKMLPPRRRRADLIAQTGLAQMGAWAK
jgi:hypothetical protein